MLCKDSPKDRTSIGEVENRKKTEPLQKERKKREHLERTRIQVPLMFLPLLFFEVGVSASLEKLQDRYCKFEETAYKIITMLQQ